jgi:small subunit ribosomal protein S20
MPQRRNAIKRLRQDKKRHAHNLKLKSELKKAVKKFHSLLSEKNLEEAKQFFKQLTSKLDKAIFKKIIHKNTASRIKSRLHKRLTKSA